MEKNKTRTNGKSWTRELQTQNNFMTDRYEAVEQQVSWSCGCSITWSSQKKIWQSFVQDSTKIPALVMGLALILSLKYRKVCWLLFLMQDMYLLLVILVFIVPPRTNLQWIPRHYSLSVFVYVCVFVSVSRCVYLNIKTELCINGDLSLTCQKN